MTQWIYIILVSIYALSRGTVLQMPIGIRVSACACVCVLLLFEFRVFYAQNLQQKLSRKVHTLRTTHYTTQHSVYVCVA